MLGNVRLSNCPSTCLPPAIHVWAAGVTGSVGKPRPSFPEPLPQAPQRGSQGVPIYALGSPPGWTCLGGILTRYPDHISGGSTLSS